MKPFSPQINSIKDQVYSIIRDKIVYLELLPGERIDENSIAGLVGASRTPRREAMMMLEMDGYVNIYPQKGTYVSLIDLNLIREIIYMRYCLEINVFSELAAKKTPVMSHVEKYLVMQEYAFNSLDFPEYVENDYAFHKKLFELAGHSQIWAIIENKLHLSTRFRITGWQTCPQEFKSTISEHRQIAECIEKNDTIALRDILSKHHDVSLSRYSEFLLNTKPEYFINN